MSHHVPSGWLRLRLRVRHGLLRVRCFGTEPSGSSGLLSLGNKVDVSVSGLPLGQVAAKFDRLLAARAVLVPAARVKKTVRVRLRGVSVSAALKALGLTTQTAPRKPRRVVKRPPR
jgi:hypothetical protein